MKTARLNQILAVLMTTAAVGLFAFSGISLSRAWPVMARSAAQSHDSAIQAGQQCHGVATRLGFDVAMTNGKLQVSLPASHSHIHELKSAFDQASIVTASCIGFQLDSFCAGSGCGGNALIMKLRPTQALLPSS